MKKYIDWLFGIKIPTHTLLVINYKTGYAKYYRDNEMISIDKLGARCGIFIEHDTIVRYEP